MRVVAFHLLNDYSGSPKVLSQLLQGWANSELDVHLFSSGGKEGFLSDLSKVKSHTYWYRWQRNPLIRLLTYSTSQLLLFFKALFFLQKEDLVYVNTVLPFGAAYAGKIRGCRVVYHLHETTVNPPILKSFLFGTVRQLANEAICVSNDMARVLHLGHVKTHILYNALETSFIQKITLNEKTESSKNVLMICSLKWYKGVSEFVQIAHILSFYNFRLVLNASVSEIEAYFNQQNLPQNLTIFPTQKDVHPHYQWADLVLNLSRPDGWIETFGLTAIEAMAYEIPVIVPPVGGISELVENGRNGYKVDSRNIAELIAKIRQILDEKSISKAMKEEAKMKIKQFSPIEFGRKSRQILFPSSE